MGKYKLCRSSQSDITFYKIKCVGDALTLSRKMYKKVNKLKDSKNQQKLNAMYIQFIISIDVTMMSSAVEKFQNKNLKKKIENFKKFKCRLSI